MRMLGFECAFLFLQEGAFGKQEAPFKNSEGAKKVYYTAFKK